MLGKLMNKVRKKRTCKKKFLKIEKKKERNKLDKIKPFVVPPSLNAHGVGEIDASCRLFRWKQS